MKIIVKEHNKKIATLTIPLSCLKLRKIYNKISDNKDVSKEEYKQTKKTISTLIRVIKKFTKKHGHFEFVNIKNGEQEVLIIV